MLSEADAARELLRRKRARNHLLEFVEYTHPSWDTGEHHKTICTALESVERGECDRLILNAPPRHSKSEIVAKRFPAWCLGKHPDWQIITASYGDLLASDIGADVRDILRDPYYQNIFPGTVLRADAQASGRWRTEQGGVYVAAGVGGPIVGRGANLAIIDDPFKNREEADSDRTRDIVWRWFMGALLTRMMPGGAIAIIMTRWHQDDLVGRILQTDADSWRVVNLQAISDEHTDKEQALWPGEPTEERPDGRWYPLSSLRRIRETMTKGGRLREWKAQYQGSPTPEEGTYIQRTWFGERYKKAPKECNVYIASDYAVTEVGEGVDPDWTEHGVFGYGPDGKLYVIDWWSGQTASDEWIEALLDLVDRWKPSTVFGEAGTIRRSIEPWLNKRKAARKSYCRVEWVPSVKNKAIRGRSFQAMAASGAVLFPETPWAEEVIEQCVAFPGAKDDKFDVLSLMCLAIDSAHPGIVLSKPDPEKRAEPWQKKQRQSSWRSA